MGLRERSRMLRKKRILASAERLFRERGYVHATIEEIAFQADVSPATVYNYYRTKPALLLALIADADEELIRASKSLIANPGPDPLAAICRLLESFTTESLRCLEAEAWRHVLAETVVDCNSDLARGLERLNRVLVGLIVSLLRSLKVYGYLPNDYDVSVAAEILYNIQHALFMDLVSEGAFSKRRYATVLRQRVEFLMACAIMIGRTAKTPQSAKSSLR